MVCLKIFSELATDDDELCLELEEHIKPSVEAAGCGLSLILRNSSYSWRVKEEEEEEEEEEEVTTLTNISLEVPTGQLVGIAGGVGAGKSSLISAILGEVRQRERTRYGEILILTSLIR